MSKNRVLLVDDERTIRSAVRRFLEAKGYEVEEAEACEAAQETFRAAFSGSFPPLPGGTAAARQ